MKNRGKAFEVTGHETCFSIVINCKYVVEGYHGTHMKPHLLPRFIQNDLLKFTNSVTLPLKYTLSTNYVHNIMLNSVVIDNA